MLVCSKEPSLFFMLFHDRGFQATNEIILDDIWHHPHQCLQTKEFRVNHFFFTRHIQIDSHLNLSK
jgi:hypothetical protein